MAGSDPPSRSGVTYRVTVTCSSTRARLPLEQRLLAHGLLEPGLLEHGLKAERTEQLGAERGDLRDPARLDAHDVQLEGAELPLARAAQVAGRARHPVGGRRDQPP